MNLLLFRLTRNLVFASNNTSDSIGNFVTLLVCNTGDIKLTHASDSRCMGMVISCVFDFVHVCLSERKIA